MKIFSGTKILLLILIIFNSSCSTVNFKKYESKNINDYKNLISKNGLSIAVDPIKESDDCVEYFGIDLIKNNILPIFITAQNKSNSYNFIVLKEKVTMKNIIGGNIENNPGGKQVESGQSSGSALAGTGGVIGTFSVIMPVAALAAAPVLLLAGGKQIADANNIKHNFIKNEFYNKTIAPNQSNYGFIYLKIPDGFNINKLNEYILSVVASDIENSNITNYEFKL